MINLVWKPNNNKDKDMDGAFNGSKNKQMNKQKMEPGGSHKEKI